MGERIQEILIERIALAIGGLFHSHLRLEATALFGGVREFAKAVGEFDSAGVELEAFSEAKIVVQRAREGGFFGGVFAQQRQASLPQLRFDVLDQNAAEEVGP